MSEATKERKELIPSAGSVCVAPGHCNVSSGIHEYGDYPGLTFGSGELDSYGYWKVPCECCARKHEREHPEDGECWPFSSQNDQADTRHE